MSWSSILTLNYVKSLGGISDTSQDAFLTAFIPYFISQIEVEIGLDFDSTDSPVTKVFRKDKYNTFVLNNTLLQIGAWQSITQVEFANVGISPIYTNLVIDQDIQFQRHTSKPNPIIRISNQYNNQFNCCQLVRVTGIQGFSSNSTIPPFLNFLLANAIKYAYRLGQVNNQAVASEKTVRLTVTYVQHDNIGAYADIFRQPFFLDFINRYKVIQSYPF